MKCPVCGSDCEADFVDVGVGEIQSGPYVCQNMKCRWIEPSILDEMIKSINEGSK